MQDQELGDSIEQDSDSKKSGEMFEGLAQYGFAMLAVKEDAEDIRRPSQTGIGLSAANSQEDCNCGLQNEPEASRAGKPFRQVY